MKTTRRRWLQYPLRGLLVLMLLSAVGAWWLSVEIDKAGRQEQAIERLEKESIYNFTVGYAHQLRADGVYDPTVAADNYKTLRSWLGDAFFDNPKAVKFTGDSISADATAGFRDLPAIEHLAITSTKGSVTLESAKNIATLSQLKSLDIITDKMEFSSEGLAALSPLPELEGFIGFFKGAIAADDVQQFVAGKQKLERLQFARCEFQPGAVAAFAELPNLKLLNLSACRFDFEDLQAFAKTSLQQLDISSTEFPTDGLKHVAKISSLRYLDCGQNAISDAGLAELSSLTNLESLILIQTQLTGTGFAALKDLAALKQVSLGKSPLSEEGLVALGSLSAIEELSLPGIEITGADLAALRHLPKLRVLQLGGAALTDADLAVLNEFPALTSLELSTFGLTDEAMTHLAELKLTELKLPNGLTASSVPFLLKMTSLKTLELPRSFSAQAAAAVKAGLPGCRVRGGTPARTRPAAKQLQPNGDQKK